MICFPRWPEQKERPILNCSNGGRCTRDDENVTSLFILRCYSYYIYTFFLVPNILVFRDEYFWWLWCANILFIEFAFAWCMIATKNFVTLIAFVLLFLSYTPDCKLLRIDGLNRYHMFILLTACQWFITLTTRTTLYSKTHLNTFITLSRWLILDQGHSTLGNNPKWRQTQLFHSVWSSAIISLPKY